MPIMSFLTSSDRVGKTKSSPSPSSSLLLGVGNPNDFTQIGSLDNNPRFNRQLLLIIIIVIVVIVVVVIVLVRNDSKQYSALVWHLVFAFLHTSCINVVWRYLGMVQRVIWVMRVDNNGSAFSSSSFPVESLNDGGSSIIIILSPWSNGKKDGMSKWYAVLFHWWCHCLVVVVQATMTVPPVANWRRECWP